MTKLREQAPTVIWNREIELLSRPELQNLQLRRLKQLITYLGENNSFYRQRFKDAAIKNYEIRSLDDLCNLPFTTKSDLEANYPTGLFSKPVNELSRVHASSGSKGKPIIVGYSKNDLALWAEVCARSLVCAGVTSADIIQNSYGYGLFTGGLGVHYGAELLGATIIPTSGGMTRRQIALLQDLQASVICCTPTYALNIAFTMAELEVPANTINLRLGIFGAEPWSGEVRLQLEEKLSLQALDIYGLSEIIGPGVAMECPQSARVNGGLHIWEDQFLVEVIDPSTGNPVPEGEEGEIVFTTLSKEALPLLRYRTGDISCLNRQPCKCGRSMVRMARVKGRLDDMLIIRGVNFYPSSLEEVLLARPELSHRYLLIVDREKALDTLILQVELHYQTVLNWKNCTDSHQVVRQQNKLKDEIKKILKDMLSLTAEVELMPPGALVTTDAKSIRVIDRRIATR